MHCGTQRLPETGRVVAAVGHLHLVALIGHWGPTRNDLTHDLDVLTSAFERASV